MTRQPYDDEEAWLMSTGRSPDPLPDAGFSPARWRAAGVFIVVGFTAIIAGGLVAAVAGPADLADGSWVAAYLVLVVGVAQLALGIGQAWLSAHPPVRARRTWQLALYNVGNVAVLVGNLIDATAAVLAGGALLFAALVLFLVAMRGARGHRLLVAGYRLIVSVLAVSIPIGLTLSVLRH